MPNVYIDKSAIKLSPKDLIAEGGEAEIYQINSSTVIKLFKQDTHPQYQMKGPAGKAMQAAAKVRIKEIQQKLPQFPHALAPNVVEPEQLVYDTKDSKRQIIGFTMPLISPAHCLRDYTQRAFRESSGISLEIIVELFAGLHQTVSKLHQHDVVIGDFNQFNVLISGKTAYLIDADSMQFSGFQCNTYSPRYADPLILENRAGQITMARNHSKETDWYAFAVLLFECLLYVHPYGGVYKPSDPTRRVSPEDRPLHRISVFHPEVRYPSIGNPIQTLPLSVQQFYEQLLIHDLRTVFPLPLLLSLDPTRKPVSINSNLLLATSSLNITATSPGVVSNLTSGSNLVPGPCSNVSTGLNTALALVTGSTPVTVLNGKNSSGAKCREIFSTSGVILEVDYDGSSLRYLYHQDGKFFREDGRILFSGNLDPSLKFAISGPSTLCGKGSRSFVFGEDDLRVPLPVELYRRQEPVFTSNSRHFFYVQHGQLFRHSMANPRLIDEVFQEQTRIWMGPEFGFGFYMAGEFRRAFLFDNEEPGRTLIDIDALSGKLLDVECRFSTTRLWLIVTLEINGQIFKRLATIDRSGRTLETNEEREGNGNWMDNLGSSCAASFPLQTGGNLEALLIATADGIVQIESRTGQIVETKKYAGTEQLVQPGERLLFTASGLYAWSSTSIRLITTS